VWGAVCCGGDDLGRQDLDLRRDEEGRGAAQGCAQEQGPAPEGARAAGGVLWHAYTRIAGQNRTHPAVRTDTRVGEAAQPSTPVPGLPPGDHAWDLLHQSGVRHWEAGR